MEIHASCKIDYESVKALTHLSLFRRFDPRKRFLICMIVCTALAVRLIWNLIIFRDSYFMGLLFVVIALFLIECYLHFILPRIRYKALAKMKEAENEYLFCDDVVKIHSKTPEYNGTSEMAYTLFVKVYETTKYFFLFKTDNHVFVVNKATIQGGTASRIREKLSASVPKEKYIVCKY